MIAVAAATGAGRRLAADVAAHLEGRLLQGRPQDAVPAAWAAADAVVLVMATGAAVRIVAPLLTGKAQDPGVVCVDDGGRFAVALVGGHEGGANRLADRVAAHLGAVAVVTTASEGAGLTGVGDLGLPVDPHVADVAAVGGALLSGEHVHLVADVRWPLGPLPDGVVETDVPTPPLLWVTDAVVQAPRPAVVLRPPSLVVGVGASRGVRGDEVVGLVAAALADAVLSPLSVHRLATVDAKADEAGLREAAAAFGVPLVALPAADLAQIVVPNPSPVVAAAVGTASVAEAAALHLGGTLLVAKRKSRMATVAVARRPARGLLRLVSLGPGGPDLVTTEARAALAESAVVVGYGPYVDQAARFARRGVRLERFDIGEEVDRARRALALAGQGRRVALVSSGDVGVYAMASPTLELAGNDVDIEVVPGVTAANAAAAALGSPLGHDHCAISLSDLLTRWEAIRRRVRAAADGDFVVSFYNPRSRARDWQLEDARRLLLEHRKPDTPVGLVTDVTRPGEQVRLTTLGELDHREVGMLTVVIVGNSQTRVRHGRMVTPRGYL